MKKTLAILCLLFITVMRASAAYEWTDGNGVTWTFDQRSFTINGTSQSLWTISGAYGYGENVTVPSTVYNGTTACTVEAIYDWSPKAGTNMTLPSTIKYIRFYSFYGGTVKVNSSTPPTFGGFYNSGSGSVTFLVPAASLNTYKAADGWKDIAPNIISQSAKTSYSISTTAQASTSGFLSSISDENLINVMSLTVTGSINSYDFMVIRDKMLNLHHLDLTNAKIVANSYTYYENCSTSNNVLGDCTFYNKDNLVSVKLPNTITSIGSSAFSGCSSLTSINIPNSVTSIGYRAFAFCNGLTSVNIPNSVTSIESSAFYSCSSLTSINIPNSVTSIESYAFYDCSRLTSVNIPNSVTSIGEYAFYNCRSLTSVSLPNSVTSIGEYAFSYCRSLTSVTMGNSVTSIGNSAFRYCSSLTEVHIPSSIRSIGEYAFANCTSLKDYYAYTIEPTTINEGTFSNWNTATLHVPLHAYNNYFVTRPWSKFYPNLVQDNSYTYENFYLTRDYVFNDAVGAMNSTPDVQLDGGSGLIVETTNSTVKLDEVHMADNGTASASIIANNNLTVENLYFDMQVTANKWYFLSFPFRVKLSNVTSPGNFVFRYYDGQTRAQSGSGGWKNVTSTYLNAHQGYIFQTNETGTLTLKVEKADMDFNGNTRQDALSSYTASSTNNASWNFVGNPHSSYFDISKTGYSAPITVWNGSTYTAVRAGDDAYYMRPFQAFFVQKPEGTSAVSFPANGRLTYLQMQEAQAAAAARANAGADPVSARQIINLTIGSDDEVDDQTRVVFNAAKSTAYELDCDASKFMSDQPVAQLYTTDADGTQYAINERPQGEVNLGFVAAKSGELTIGAARMDCPVYLRDNELNITHDLSVGGYTFTADQGSNEQRFTLVMSNTVTGVEEVHSSQPAVHGSVYDLQGRRMADSQYQKGVRIVKKGQKVTKVITK